MQAFVTGGSGFLGFHLIKQLLEKGWNVVAMHRNGSDLTDLKQLGFDKLTFVESSFFDHQQLLNAVPDNCDAIFHIAGDTSTWFKNNEKQYEMNVTATKNLLAVAKDKNIGRFIHTSSISAYGFHDETITEQSPRLAMSSGVNYLKTKYLGEMEVKNAVSNGLDAVVLNPCAIMGSHDKHNWSQLFTMINENTLPGVPSGEGSYCHVEEVAKAHISAFEIGVTGENYILAGTDCSFLEVVKKIGLLLSKSTPNKAIPAWVLRFLGQAGDLISRITNKEPNMTPEKAMLVTKRVIASSDKAVAELGYNDKIEIDVMLADCYNWLKDTGRI